MRNSIIASALLLTFAGPAAHAADTDTTTPASETPRVVITLPVVEETRPAVLPILYASFAGLQAFDVYSTHAGLSRGAAELNPIVAPVARDTAAMIALKAVSTASTIYMAERLWHRNRTAAVLTMVAANSVMAIVAANNARVLHQTR